VRAQVAADVDFSQTEQMAETYKPNPTPNTAIRSQQTAESGSATPSATGIPGALSNQPPVPATAPITTPAVPGAAATANAAQPNNMSRNATTNYELDKTVRVTRNATGVVRRLNAAVVLNHRSTTDPKGKVNTTPVPQEELDKLTALVKETMGFSQDRGDSVRVVSAPFVVEKTDTTELPLWKQPWVLDMVRAAAWPVGISLAVALLLLGLVRPLIKGRQRAAAPVQGGQLHALAADELERPALPAPVSAEELQPTAEQLRLEEARKLARDNPAAVAHIVRGWVSGEQA